MVLIRSLSHWSLPLPQRDTPSLGLSPMRTAKAYNLAKPCCIIEEVSNFGENGDRERVTFIKIGSSQNIVTGYSNIGGETFPTQPGQFLCVREKLLLLSLDEDCPVSSHEFLSP